MYVRFVVADVDEDSQCKTGIFQKAAEVVRESDCDQEVVTQLRQCLRWFSEQLPPPKRFSRSAKPNPQPKAISWFKPTAVDCIRQTRVMVSLLKQTGVAVEEMTTRNPGYVVYEDEHQVTAIPFSQKRR